MTPVEFSLVLDRDLRRLVQEIEAYPSDEALWAALPGAVNPGGNLGQHLCGNLREYVGRLLGNAAYERDRPAEFAARTATRAELVARIEETRALVVPVLRALGPAVLAQPYPIEVLGHQMTTGYFLLHLLGHFNYHLGQIDVHRRQMTGDGALKLVNA